MQKRLEVLEKEFVSDLESGLSEEQVAINRETYGVNQLEEKEKTPLIVKFFEQFKDPLIIILIIAAVVSMIIDPHEWVESLIIMIVVLVNAILGLYQENKAEKSLEALTNTTIIIINDSIHSCGSIIIDTTAAIIKIIISGSLNSNKNLTIIGVFFFSSKALTP